MPSTPASAALRPSSSESAVSTRACRRPSPPPLARPTIRRDTAACWAVSSSTGKEGVGLELHSFSGHGHSRPGRQMQAVLNAGGSSKQELKRALFTLWPHFAMAGLFSGAINLLYLSSPLYLMQVYNRVLVSENVPTLILLTVILGLALVTMAALDSLRAQLLIRC